MRGPGEATEDAAARGPQDPAAVISVSEATQRCLSDTLLVVRSWLGVSDTAPPPEGSHGEMEAFLREARAAGPAVQFLAKSARLFAAGDRSGGSYWAEAASQLAWEVIHTGENACVDCGGVNMYKSLLEYNRADNCFQIGT